MNNNTKKKKKKTFLKYANLSFANRIALSSLFLFNIIIKSIWPTKKKKKGTPTCNTLHNVIHYADMGASFGLDCNVSAYPAPDSYQWILKKAAHSKHLETTGNSVLVYTVRNWDDYGVVQCTSSNYAGMQQSPCTFIIKQISTSSAFIFFCV